MSTDRQFRSHRAYHAITPVGPELARIVLAAITSSFVNPLVRLELPVQPLDISPIHMEERSAFSARFDPASTAPRVGIARRELIRVIEISPEIIAEVRALMPSSRQVTVLILYRMPRGNLSDTEHDTGAPSPDRLVREKGNR